MQHQEPNAGIGSARSNLRSINTKITSGQILSETFRAFGTNFTAFSAISALCILPGFAIHIVGLLQGNGGLAIGGQVLISLFTIPAQGAMVYGTVQFMAGRKVDIIDNIQQGFSSMLSVLGVGIAVMLVVALGFVMLVIPGFIFLMMFYVAVPVAVVERVGVSASMERSKMLTDGVRWIIFGAIVVLLLMQALFVGGVQGLGTQVLGLGKHSWELATMTTFVETFLGAIGAVMSAVVYVRLRRNNDDIDAEELSNVFS